ncbi:MAG: hypothetical protein ABIS50_03230 [Luteolibacter sp.]|uniref:hypothetical protein n=1 Tax=Luteolibacter sp. TaxID=1962973 RepID=UPI003266013C
MTSPIRSIRLAAIASTAVLASCAATVRSPSSADLKMQPGGTGGKKIVMAVKGSEVAAKSADWELLRAEWRTSMASATQAAGMSFSYQESEPKSGSEKATAVIVEVKDYRYISPGARYGLGIMTGNAYMDADVRFVDLGTGKGLGTKNYNTSSTAWQGIFSAMTEKQIQAICAEIVKDVSKK